MASTFCIGIDISKLTLDVAVLKEGVLLLTHKIDNSEAAIRQLLIRLKSHHHSTAENTVFCAENMGIYGKFLVDVLAGKTFRLCLESPLQIKRSLGIQRSKSDLLDAIRIAEYVYKNEGTLKFRMPPRPPVQQLKTLTAIRKRLLKMIGMLKNVKNVELHFLSAVNRKEVGGYSQATLAAIKSDIAVLEKEMAAIVKADDQLRELVRLVMSVPHIGKTIAIQLVIITNEFRDFSCPKKFASYCGIAPFTKTSGTSVNQRPKISHIANKEMKTLLHMAALGSALPGKSKSKFKSYYSRMVASGKNRMSVLNAVRNKLVRVIFACVREKRLYVEVE